MKGFECEEIGMIWKNVKTTVVRNQSEKDILLPCCVA